MKNNDRQDHLLCLQVACAIIERNGLVLAAQRSASMTMPLKWEFPGGKIETGESPEEALHRELMEEMGLRVVLKQALPPSTYRYPAFAVRLYPFICAIQSGEVTLHEHRAVRWVHPDDLAALDWVDADREMIKAYRQTMTLLPTIKARETRPVADPSGSR